MIRQLKNANFWSLALGSTRSTDFRSYPEVKNSTIRMPLKSYTNPLKIIRLLPILHEQFKFYVPQHRRALVPCGLVSGQIRLQNRIPRTQISLSPNFLRHYYFNSRANCLPAKNSLFNAEYPKVILTPFP